MVGFLLHLIVIRLNGLDVLEDVHVILMSIVTLQSCLQTMVPCHASIKLLLQSTQLMVQQPQFPWQLLLNLWK
uniref:Uncharacterized protein MANES_14G073300 n=1 Tax=Rhizophora mucronata TaxID=61149 RepID=A0A2P2MX26_RHIMU